MKKSILNIGKALNKAEQKSINGGNNDCSIASVCEGCWGFASGGSCLGGPATWFCCDN